MLERGARGDHGGLPLGRVAQHAHVRRRRRRGVRAGEEELGEELVAGPVQAAEALEEGGVGGGAAGVVDVVDVAAVLDHPGYAGPLGLGA